MRILDAPISKKELIESSSYFIDVDTKPEIQTKIKTVVAKWIQ